jgi:quinol-cytochrome oxidoreductase complex cytochrome b subunit
MNILIERWAVYILFVLFILNNIVIEYLDTGTNEDKNKTIRIIQIIVNCVLILLLTIFLVVKRSFISKFYSAKQSMNFMTNSSKYKEPIMKKMDSKLI